MAKSNQSTKNAWFFVLLGTLSFSLSSLPGHAYNHQVQSRSLSSLEEGRDEDLSGVDNGCDYKEQLDLTEKGHCISKKAVEGVNVKGDIAVVVKTVKRTHHLTEDGQPKEETKQMINISFKLESDCSTCYLGKHPATDSFSVELSQLNDLSNIIQERFEKDAVIMTKAEVKRRKEKADAEAKAKKVANCEINNEGKSLSGHALVTCQIDKMSRTADENEAAQIYEKEVRPKLEGLLASNSPAARREGRQLLAQLNKNGAGGDFVKESLSDMTKFADNKDSALQLLQAANSMAPNDPRRAQLMLKAQQLGAAADTFFQNRENYNAQNPWASQAGGFDYTNAMANDLNLYRAQLDQSFATILALQQQASSAYNTSNNNRPGVNGSPYVTNPTMQTSFNNVTGVNATNAAAGSRPFVLPAGSH